MLELVDEVDSKSIASDGVRVRVPPPAPSPQPLDNKGVAGFSISLRALIYGLIFSRFWAIFRRDIGGTSEVHASNRSRIDAQNRVGRSNLGAEIQVRIDVGSGGNIAVPQPLLDLPQTHAVCKQETGAAMAKVC